MGCLISCSGITHSPLLSSTLKKISIGFSYPWGEEGRWIWADRVGLSHHAPSQPARWNIWKIFNPPNNMYLAYLWSLGEGLHLFTFIELLVLGLNQKSVELFAYYNLCAFICLFAHTINGMCIDLSICMHTLTDFSF